MNAPPLLELRGLARTFPTPAGPLPVLHDFSLVLHPGERLLLHGPSGSGKTTLLHLIALLDRPNAGSLLWRGQDCSAWNESQRCRHRARHIGLVFQHFHCLPHRDVRHNLRLRFGIDSPPDPDREDALLEAIGLLARADHPARLLSGGELQRLCIARALLHRPTLLLADEPTGNLDDANAARVRDLFLRLASPETTLVIATHDPRWLPIATRTLSLSSPPPPPLPSPHPPPRHTPPPPPSTLFLSCLLAALLLGAALHLHARAARETAHLQRAWPPRSVTLRFPSTPTPADLARAAPLLPPGEYEGLLPDGRTLWIDGSPTLGNATADLFDNGHPLAWISPESASRDHLFPGDLLDIHGLPFRVAGLLDGPYDADRLLPWRAASLPTPRDWRVRRPAAEIAPRLLDPDVASLGLELIDHDRRRADIAAPLRRLRLLLHTLAGVVALLTGLVLHTRLLALARERRTEIGLRRALGAHPRDILLLFLREAVASAAAAIALGLLPWLLVLPPTPLLLGGLLLTAWCAACALPPARHAALLPPAQTLRGA